MGRDTSTWQLQFAEMDKLEESIPALVPSTERHQVGGAGWVGAGQRVTPQSGVVGFWGLGILGFWGLGILGCWHLGILGFWGSGVLGFCGYDDS